MAPAILLILALGIVAYGLATGGGFAAKVARLAGRTSRPRMVSGWAAGTAVTYAAPSLIALALLGRIDAVLMLPPELHEAAAALGIAGPLDGESLAHLGGSLGLGAVIGITILFVRRRMGRAPIGLGYRSAAAMRTPGEAPAAAALALSAGVSEELFFRLLLPLLFALVTGQALAGFALALVAFVALHRHQRWLGMLAVGIVGAALTYLYLLTGRLWVVMLLHVVIDLNALVLRPWLTRVSSSAATPS